MIIMELKTPVIALAVALVAICIAPPAFASKQQTIAKAAQLLELGQAQNALALLETGYVAEAATLQELFLLGMAAKDSQDLPKSELYLRQAVSTDPSVGRIKLELAEVLALQGKLTEARAELQSVQAMNPPQEVQQNIERFISQIDAAGQNQGVGFAQGEAPKNWSAYISAGLSYDSNVNASTDDDSVTFFGLPFRLSDDAQETDDGAWTLRAGVSHRIALNEKITWDTGLHGSFTDYFTADPYDNLSLQFSTGPSFALSEKGLISIPLTLSAQSYTDSPDDWYSVSYGVAPRVQYALTEKLQFGLNTSLSRKVYIESRERDSTVWSLAPSLRFKPFEQAGVFSFGGNYGREDSGLDIYSNESKGVYLSYEHVFPEVGVRADITARYSDAEYDGVQASNTVARHDQATSVSGSLIYALKPTKVFSFAENSEVSLSASYTDNRSNLEVNEYDRTQVSLTLTKRF